MSEWISIRELAQREKLADITIRRLAGLQHGHSRRISFRRRGLGRRAALEFNYPVVKRQLEVVLGREGVKTEADHSPTLFTLIGKVDALTAAFAQLAAKLSEGKPTS